MNIKRRSLLKALGIGMAAAVTGVLVASDSDIGWEAIKAAGELMDAQPAPEPIHLVNVYSEADLPAPVGGVITLAENTTYTMMNAVGTKHPIKGPKRIFGRMHTPLYSAIQKTIGS